LYHSTLGSRVTKKKKKGDLVGRGQVGERGLVVTVLCEHLPGVFRVSSHALHALGRVDGVGVWVRERARERRGRERK
jgi:hypothetical protein